MKILAKPADKPQPAAQPEDAEAALCEYELDARRENELRAKRKRTVESSRPAKQ
jgi:hypothetical protein